MTITLAHIWRHPVKSHGREALDQVVLTAGQTLPWDRTWAVAHEGAKADGSVWAACANFSRGAKAPQLMAIETTLDTATEKVTFRHPNRPEITLHPERDSDRLLDWVKPLMPENRAQSTRVMRVPDRGMTDTDFPSVSLGNLESHRAVEAQLGHEISQKRWRINLWVDGLDEWAEFQLVGKTLAIGDVRLEVREPIERCMATAANPETGERDADTLGTLRHWNHQDFGIHTYVTTGGEIKLGDRLQVL